MARVVVREVVDAHRRLGVKIAHQNRRVWQAGLPSFVVCEYCGVSRGLEADDVWLNADDYSHADEHLTRCRDLI